MTAAFKTALGNNGNSTSGTTLVITTTAAIAVGDIVVVRWAADNLSASTPTGTVTDTGGNSYTAHAFRGNNATAASGVVGGINVCQATVAVASGQSITLTLSGAVTAKAMYAESFTGVENILRNAAVLASGASTTSTVTSNSANTGDLVVGNMAVEDRAAPTFDSDTSNGSWSTGVTKPNATSGTVTNCVETNGQYKITTGAGTQTYNHTNANTDWAAMVIVLKALTNVTATRATTWNLQDDTGWITFADGVSTATTATVTGLTPGTSYDFRVRAVNADGPSDPSTVVSATPTSSGPTTPVSTTISTTWTTRANVTPATRATTWAVIGRITATRSTTWNVSGALITVNQTPLLKGVSVNYATGNPATVQPDLNNLNCSWWYDWASYATPILPATTTQQYVPMVWGDWINDPQWGSATGDGSLGGPPQADLGPAMNLLGFNEPNVSTMANMTVARALALWPQLDATGARLGAPAVSNDPGLGGGEAWLDAFMSGNGGPAPRVDFLCAHWYPEYTQYPNVGDYLDYLHTRYGKPIWITEIGTLGTSIAANASLIPTVMTALSTRPWVERIAWFVLDRNADSGFPTSQLTNSSGVLNAAGTAYAGYASGGSMLRPTRWNVVGRIVATRGTTWVVRTPVTTTRNTLWNTATITVATKSTTWTVKTPVTATRATTWQTSGSVSNSRSTTWTVDQGVLATRSTTWNVAGATTTVQATRSTTWTAYLAIQGTRATTWVTRSSATGTRSTTWNASAIVTATRATSWFVDANVPAPPSTRTSSWVVRALVGQTRLTLWNVQTTVSSSRATTWGVVQGVVATRSTTWNVAGSLVTISTSRSTTWSTLSAATSSKTTSWNARALVSGVRPTTWTVLTPITGTRLTTWVVARGITSTRATTWSVVQGVMATRSTTWSVASSILTVATSRATLWNVRSSCVAERPTLWTTKTTVSLSRGTTWTVGVAVLALRATTWMTLQRINASRATTWRVAGYVTARRSTRWDVHALEIIAVFYPWTVAYFGDAPITAMYQGSVKMWQYSGGISGE